MSISKKKVLILLAERGLTVAAAAEKCGLLPNNLTRILSRGKCQTVTAGKIAAALGVPVSDIIEG